MRECIICDEPFEPKQARSVCCYKPLCKREHKNNARAATRHCQLCGDTLPPRIGSTVKFCDKHHVKPQIRRANQATSRGGFPISTKFECHAVRDWLRGMGGDFDVDHWVPLILGGNHHPDNCYVLHDSDNGNKQGRIPYADWTPPAEYVELPDEARTLAMFDAAYLVDDPNARKRRENCDVCGQFFTTTDRSKRCSDACDDRAAFLVQREYKGHQDGYTFDCPTCGESTTKPNRRYQYCSKRCQGRAYARRQYGVAIDGPLGVNSKYHPDTLATPGTVRSRAAEARKVAA